MGMINIKKIGKGTIYMLITTLIILIACRLYLPYWTTDYVNKTLQEIPNYSGHISGVDICLLKGEYRINNAKIYKKGYENDPLFAAPAIDLSVQWGALKNGKIRGEIDVYQPEVNIIMVDADGANQGSQTGVDVDWTEPIKELMPLEINRFEIYEGKLSYKDPAQDPAIDIFANELHIVATNFSNASDMEHPLPSTITASGSSIGGGKMYMTTRINPLKKIPDLDYEFKFEGVNLSALNDFTDAYAALDFEDGTIDLFSEMAIKDGNIDGYFKPVLNNIDLINFREDIRNPLKLIWESFAALVLEVFENQGLDQFATKVPMVGNLNNPNTKIWPTLLGILQNAFVDAFTKKVDDSIDFDEVESEDDNQK